MDNWISKLERAKALLDAGALTSEQYEAEKKRLLPPIPHHSKFGSLEDGQPISAIESHSDDDVPTARYSGLGGSRLIVGLILTAGIAFGGYWALQKQNSSHQTPAQLPPVTAEIPPKAPIAEVSERAKIPAQLNEDRVGEFECLGAYSDISFSEETGDGSGLFVRIGRAGKITWKYYEGGPSEGKVQIVERTPKRIVGKVSYDFYPNDPPSETTFECNNGNLTVKNMSHPTGNMKKLSVREAAELDR